MAALSASGAQKLSALAAVLQTLWVGLDPPFPHPYIIYTPELYMENKESRAQSDVSSLVTFFNLKKTFTYM